MTNTQLTVLFDALVADARSTMACKNRDYTAASDDALKNFKEVAEQLGLSPRQVWSVYFMKHVMAVLAWAKTGKVESEGLRGRFIDLVNYAALGLAVSLEPGKGSIQDALAKAGEALREQGLGKAIVEASRGSKKEETRTEAYDPWSNKPFRPAVTFTGVKGASAWNGEEIQPDGEVWKQTAETKSDVEKLKRRLEEMKINSPPKPLASAPVQCLPTIKDVEEAIERQTKVGTAPSYLEGCKKMVAEISKGKGFLEEALKAKDKGGEPRPGGGSRPTLTEDPKSYTPGFGALWDNVAKWSTKTFGTDQERGPAGPLKHMAKEVQEALQNPQDPTEYADILILLCDASRRAGLSTNQILNAAWDKMDVNRKRTWPKPTSDEPVEHVRTKEELEAAK